MSDLNLLAIMQTDPGFAERIKQGTEEVRKSKENLVSAAENFNTNYRDEIEEGTKKKRLLLEMGKQEGKSEEDILREYGQFIPTKHTPILNFLYFLMRDGHKPDWVGIQRNLNEQYGHKMPTEYDKFSESDVDKIFAQMMHDEDVYANTLEPDDMDHFIYGNCTHDMFKKIKKLKALSKSSNENEAFLAYRLCLKLCKQYGFEFDKVPCNIEE